MDIYQGCCHDLALVKNGAIDKAQEQYVLLVDHNDQLAAAKAEIAELVDALDKLLDDAYGSADQVHYEYGIGEQVYDESITNAEKLLAKHKGE